MTHYQRPTVTQLQEGGTGGEVSEILFFSAKSKRRPSLIYPMQIIPVCLSIVARRKGVSATRRGGLNWTPISLLVGHPCKLVHRNLPTFELRNGSRDMEHQLVSGGGSIISIRSSRLIRLISLALKSATVRSGPLAIHVAAQVRPPHLWIPTGILVPQSAKMHDLRT